jgi:phosphoglucomutase
LSNSEIEKRLEQIAQSPNGGREAAANLYSWLSDTKSFVDKPEVRQFVQKAPADLVIDSFRMTIPFGTGGRRGPVGIGPNRINYHIVALTAAGHAEYLRKTTAHERILVVVANDTRIFTDISGRHKFMGQDWPLLGVTSRDLAVFACKVYAAYGIETYITSPDDSDAFMPTPELSFVIREMSADGGLNVSASHNHPDDNGLKVYNPSGGQYFPPQDEDLARAVEEVELPEELAVTVSKLEKVAKPIPEDLHIAYIDLYANMNSAICRGSITQRSQIPIVYTPLCGTGLESVGKVLSKSGYEFHVPPDQYPDGSFSAIPMRSPNPEIIGVAQPAIDYASTVGAGLVLSTDPDADRLGVEVQLQDGSWKHFTGNKIAAVLAYYLAIDPNGPKLQGSIITTVATSKILATIGSLSNKVATIDDLMIGFKFIGQRLDVMATDHSPRKLILAAEESHGYLTTDRIRDKDAASAAFIIAYLHLEMQQQGKTLWDYLMRVYEDVGVHVEFGRSLVFPGAEGASAIKVMMRSLREDPPSKLGGERLINIRDYLDEKPIATSTRGERAAFDVLEISSDHYRAVIRPSGTEAKLKYYFDYHEAPIEDTNVADRYQTVEPLVWSACSMLYSDLATRSGYPLSESALELPDVMPVPTKAERKEY